MKLYPAGSDDTKLYAHFRIGGYNVYNFFDVGKGGTKVDIDMTQINKTPLAKTITSTGTNLSVTVLARPDKQYYSNYFIGTITAPGNQVNYYYPSEPFAEYITKITYKLGNLDYYFTKNSSIIPDKTDTYNGVINTPASTLATFKPSFSGSVDYYAGYFESEKSGPGFYMQLFSPAAAYSAGIKFPDFSKYLGVKSVDLSKETLISFALFRDGTFDETRFPYKANGTSSYPDLDLRSVTRNYRP
ncbi:hypothetical protein SNE25_00675 [Mucilaginibacter sabulilitoris]|uniref:Uncharacterized protein n=1 Tax=Mucilaginibacter sabulilitoris TaxID=1173583 RepID=A0ABZ0TLJ9_9SPHI|nr:hypothetical protein [Mucilaginibacter sabulilitoris]WPU94037.1 hypothetical protein SNE25_00675 [Mucilaginibacter sabulilitoris]